MTYQRFAYLYDTLMEDVPYDRWVEWVIHLTDKHGLGKKKIMDLACGTGELSVRLAKAGFDVTGIDLSEDMLAVAQTKADGNGLSIPFYHQDMTGLTGLGQFEMIGIFCDSLNYLPETTDVEKTFAGVFQHLEPGGLFLFDVHSLYKMDVIFQEGPFTLTDDNISYIWECFQGEYPLSVEHELTFFVFDEETGQYDRVEEYHFQRTYEIEKYIQMLNTAGFELVDIMADFKPGEPGPEAERILFTAKKGLS